ncbi:unnamed protein product [Adineta steineri]|uniref:Uncharacterized protein n=1 Tax=Adineta steineri TaxID=433720 RepID=A0A819LFB6_9BILA|nr:unnamed protein product [Adineta steineri]
MFNHIRIIYLLNEVIAQHHLFQESVALTLTKGNDRIDRNAVIKVIGRYIPVEDVDSFGNLGDHDKWFIIFKSSASKEKFLTLENLEVDDQVFAQCTTFNF